MAGFARRQGYKRLFVPEVDADEAALITGIDVIPIDHLTHLVNHLSGVVPIPPQPSGSDVQRAEIKYPVDLTDVKGQEHVKRALEVAAAGGHNIFFSGPPGSGKTLITRCLPTIFPSMNEEEALDVTRIYSVADQLPEDTPLLRARPFRAPHHTISYAGLIGGGRWPKPGEISLAHRGVLFLTNFTKPVTETNQVQLFHKRKRGTFTLSELRNESGLAVPTKNGH